MTRKTQLALSLSTLALVHGVVLSAAFIAPDDPAEQNRALPFAPPMRLHWRDGEGKLHLRPFVYPWVANPVEGSARPYLEDHSRRLPLRFFVRRVAHTPASEARGPHSTIPTDLEVRAADLQGAGLRYTLFGVDPPARLFLLGTDDYGRDLLSRLLYGGQISLFAGLIAAVLALGLGLLLGSLSGYYGGWLDSALMRGSEIIMAVPWIYLLFAVRAFLPLQLSPRATFFLLTAVIGLAGWARPARLVRGVVLSAKQRDYVEAARGFGASNFYILRRHVLPETLAVALTQAALLIPQYILAEVTFSFLGLGVGEPVASWGNMLASLQHYYVLESYPWMFAPGLALVSIFLLYHWCGDALQAGS